MPELPLTVLMTVHNGEPYLYEAIKSILNQTYSNFRFLILDDASTDNSREIIYAFKDSRIDLVELPENIGQTRALNQGLQMINTPIVTRMDADDISLPQRLEKQLTYMDWHPDVVLLGTQGYIIDQRGKVINLLDLPSLDHISIHWRHCCYGNSFIHSSVMFRKDVIWDKFGGYDEAFSYCQDFDLWSKVLQRYPVANLYDRLINWRTHSASMTVKMHEIGIREAKSVMCRNLSETFAAQGFSEIEFDLISDFNPAFDTKRIYSQTFLDLFHRLLITYQKLFPEALTSQSFRDTVAEQYAWLGYKLLVRNPGLAFDVLLRGVKYSPRSFFSPILRRLMRLWSKIRFSNEYGINYK